MEDTLRGSLYRSTSRGTLFPDCPTGMLHPYVAVVGGRLAGYGLPAALFGVSF